MRFSKIFCLVLIMFLSELAFGQAKILHSPPREVYTNTPILIESIIEGNRVGVQRVRIFFRETGQSAFIEGDMSEYMGVYKAMIPAEYVKENGVEYLIVAEFTDGSMCAYPETDPYNVPMFLTVRRKTDTSGNTLSANLDAQGGIPSNAIVLSPEEGEIVPAEEVLVAVSLFTAPDVALQSILVELDGKNITREAEISEDLISVRPKNMTPGIHTVKMVMNNRLGDPFSPIVVHFTVVRGVEEAQRFLDVSSRITAETNSEQVRGIRQNISQIRGDLSGQFDWLQFNAQVMQTSLEDPTKQPKNRLSASLTSSFLDLRFGDVNPRFSEFGLNGKRVRGIEANLKLKYFNFHLVTGETERVIPGTISGIPDTSIDGLEEYSRTGYTYSRKLWAFRPYFGSGKHFQFGLSFLKALDDTLSVKKNYGGIRDGSGVNINMTGSNKPQDNIALGTDLLLSFDNRRFVWKTDFAVSYANRNITGGPLDNEELDTFAPGDTIRDSTLTFQGKDIALKDIPFDLDDIGWLFIINRNIKPFFPIDLDTTGVVGLYSFLNMPSSAFKTFLTLNYFNNYFTFKYQRVGPEFVSLGNPYQRTDVQGFQVGDKIRLFGNRLFVTLNFEQLRDNLNKDKSGTTTTTTFSAGISLYPGEGLPTINFNTMQYSRKNDIETIDTTFYYNLTTPTLIDSFKLRDKRESNMTMRQDITISHLIEFGGVKHNINLSYANSDRSDLVSGRVAGFQFNSMSTSMISFGINSTFKFPLKTYLKISTNKNESGLASKPYQFLSLATQGQYDFLNGQISVLGGYNLMNGSGLVDFSQHNIYIGAYYRIFKIHMLRGRVNETLISDRLSDERFNDLSFSLSYSVEL